MHCVLKHRQAPYINFFNYYCVLQEEYNGTKTTGIFSNDQPLKKYYKSGQKITCITA